MRRAISAASGAQAGRSAVETAFEMTVFPDAKPAIALVAPSLDSFGGQGVQARALTDVLRRDQYSVTLVPINPRFPKSLQWLRRFRYVRTVLSEALYLLRLAELRHADVVHIFSASYWSFLLAPAPAILAAKLLRKPVILHYHSGEAADHLARWRWSVAPFLRLVDAIVVPSSYLQKIFAWHGYRASVIPNLVDKTHFPYRERVPLRPRLLSVRNLERHYRVDNTIRAFARVKALFPEATLTIVGEGTQDPELQRLVNELGIHDVQFTGPIDPDSLPAVYDAADIFLNSSVVDNQPVSILEAFASGLPVISTPTGDIAAMLRGGEAGLLIEPEDPAAMADAVTRLLSEPTLSLRVARRAREEAEKYAWPRVREQWTTLYAELAAARRRALSANRSGLRRLLTMPWPELACRSRQEILRLAERVQCRAKKTVLFKTVGRPSRHEDPASFDRFLRNANDRFFHGPYDRHLPATLAIHSPSYCKELVQIADEICEGRFDLLGHRGLNLGNPPDWRFDPISGWRAPFLHWTRFDRPDDVTFGDPKVICELNRHQWLVYLGQAYRVTGEERYADAVVQYWKDWLRANPPGMGINWCSSLELALRLIAWCWTLLLLRDSRALTPSVFAALAESVKAHARHIERYLSYYFSPNTHLTGEALGLLYVGVLFTHLDRAQRWRSLGTSILLREIERQVLSDGVYFELSTCYQRYTVDTYLHFLILASRAGIEVPPIVRQRVQAMLDFFLTVRHPDGSMPSIGDGDDGQLLPLSKTQPADFRATFSTAAVLFKSPAYAWAAGEIAPDTMWLLGVSAVDTFKALQASPPSMSEACRVFPNGGFAVLRTGWDEQDHSLIFDTGPLGCPVSSGHGHADLLSVQCSAFGQQYLVDAGTCCYAANPEIRDFFRGTAAHSSVVVDGEGQAAPAGPFAWQSRPTTQLLRWISNERFTFADAEHDGYRALPDPVRHRRRVIFVKPRFWLLVDDLTGAANHCIEIRFQFAPMQVRVDANRWVRATLDGRHGLLLHTFATEPLNIEVREGRRAPLEGWISPNYGRVEPAPALVYTTKTLLPMRTVTLLWPSERVHEETPAVEVIHNDQGLVTGLAFPELGEVVVFEDGDVAVEHRHLSYRESAIAAS